MNFSERQYFGAKLEPVKTVLHGAGQDLDSFRSYAALFPRDNQPAAFMTYIGITGDRARVMEWGERLQRERQAIGKEGLSLQIGLSMTGGNDQGMGMEEAVARGEKDDNLALFCDWWGIDTFDAAEMTSRATQEFCAAAGEHGKPVMIGEATPPGIGVLDGQASWEAWFAPFFALIQRQPEIKLFSYINWDWPYWSDALGFAWHDWGDCRIEQNSVVAGKYLAEMATRLYEHQAN